MRKAVLSLLFFLFFCLSAYARSPGTIIDVQHYTYNLRLSDSTNLIKGKAEISVKFLKDATAFTLSLSDKMQVGGVTENGDPLSFKQTGNTLNITATVQTSAVHTYTITYQGMPDDGLIISTNRFGKRTFFGDNWPDRAHDWLPCVDDPADKATVDFIVTAPDHYQVISNGLKTEESVLPNHLKLTHWKESIPIPTKVMVIGVADFAVAHTGDVSGIPVYSYVFPQNKAAGFKSYAGAKDILAFFQNKFGPYAYEKLANVQSKTIFDGMENAGCIFYVETSVDDKEIEALMAHEIAHQWFGDAVTEKSFQHVWLSEGFATYMTNAYFENKYSAAAFKNRLVKDREKILNYEATNAGPVVDTTVKNTYMRLLNTNSYEKGSWVLHMLRRKLGDEVFWRAIRAYYTKYVNGNANTDDLREVMEQISGQNLAQFFKQWLYTPGIPEVQYSWQYDEKNKLLNLTIVQNQDIAFEFPLQFLVEGKMETVNIKDKTSYFQAPVAKKPAKITIDPDVNLLARFQNVNIK